MLKKVIILLISFTLIMPMGVLADNVGGENTLSGAGITPDSMLYSLDRGIENLVLALTFDEEKKVDRYNDNAEERLAEGKKMADENKPEYTQEALEGYKEALEKAIEVIEEAVGEDKDITEASDETAAKVNELKGIIEEIAAVLPDEDKEEVLSKLSKLTEDIQVTNEAVAFIQNDTKDEDEDKDKDKDEDKKDEEEDDDDAARQVVIEEYIAAHSEEIGDAAGTIIEEKLNLRQIAVVMALSENTAIQHDLGSVDDTYFNAVLNIFLENHKGIGATIKHFGLKPQEAFKNEESGIKKVYEEAKKAVKDLSEENDSSLDPAVDEPKNDKDDKDKGKDKQEDKSSNGKGKGLQNKEDKGSKPDKAKAPEVKPQDEDDDDAYVEDEDDDDDDHANVKQGKNDDHEDHDDEDEQEDDED